MSLVSIKVDNIAALREMRHFREPDPSQAAVLAELAGADGITCHLREDRRYARDRDVVYSQGNGQNQIDPSDVPGR